MPANKPHTIGPTSGELLDQVIFPTAPGGVTRSIVTESEPAPLSVPLRQVLDEALRPILGDNLEAYHVEVERHDRELREIPGRVQQQMHPAFQAIVAGGTGEPEENGYGVAAEMEVLQVRVHETVRQALLAEMADHRRRVSELVPGAGQK